MRTLLVAALLLASCASVPSVRAPKSSLNVPPSETALAAADYGPAPGEGHEALIQAAMASVLKDPESARYRFAAPRQGWMPRYHFDARSGDQPHQHGQVFGWLVDFGVNAKNSFGGYVGEKAYIAFFQHERLAGILQLSPYEDTFGYPCWFRVR